MKRILSAVILALLLLPGCGLLNKNPGQQSQQQEQTEKAPKQLEEIEKNIEKVFLALGGPALESKEEKEKQDQGQEKQQEDQQQGEQKQEDKKSSEDQDQSKSKDQEKDQGEQKDKQETQAPPDPWQQVSQAIKSLHTGWNDYLPEVTKKGGSKELIDQFGTALNDLTKAADTKDKDKTLMAANAPYQRIPDLYSLYKTKASPELKRLIYYARNTVLLAKAGDWAKAGSNMEDLKSLWSLAENTIGKEQQEDAAKLDLSIYELEKVAKEKNGNLVEIKGKIALGNIGTLIEAMNKDSK